MRQNPFILQGDPLGPIDLTIGRIMMMSMFQSIVNPLL